MVIYAGAMLLGVSSRVPGNLGMIKATRLIGLPQLPAEDLLASLMMRVLYLVLPLLEVTLLLAGPHEVDVTLKLRPRQSARQMTRERVADA